MRWKAFLAAIIIFFAGTATGAIAARSLAPKMAKRAPASAPSPLLSAERKKEYLNRLDRELQLTPEQRQKAEEILNTSQERIKKIWDQVAPQAKEEFRRARREIAEILTPEQKERLDKIKKQRHNRWREEKRKNEPIPAPPG